MAAGQINPNEVKVLLVWGPNCFGVEAMRSRLELMDMPRPTYLISALLGLLLLTLPVGALATQPCQSGPQAIRDTNVVLSGRVLWAPIDGVTLLQVEAYHRGLGRRYIWVTHEYSYEPVPWYARGYNGARGSGEISVFGVRQNTWGYVSKDCDLFASVEILPELDLAPARPPLPGYDPRSVMLFGYLISRAAAVVLATLVAVRVWRKLRAK